MCGLDRTGSVWGVKESGLGREGSVLGLEEFLEVKTLHIGDYNRQGGICRPPVPGGWQ